LVLLLPKKGRRQPWQWLLVLLVLMLVLVLVEVEVPLLPLRLLRCLRWEWRGWDMRWLRTATA
jgi:hypothetical protein